MDFFKTVFDSIAKDISRMMELSKEEDDVSLAETLVEKIGGGPHELGDPNDRTIRDREHNLLPRMIWRKINYEKCLPQRMNFINCTNDTTTDAPHRCMEEFEALSRCKQHYYTEQMIDKIEQECIVEYVNLRSEFRLTNDPKVLRKIKDLMLAPLRLH